jgi:hypothetical protein
MVNSADIDSSMFDFAVTAIYDNLLRRTRIEAVFNNEHFTADLPESEVGTREPHCYVRSADVVGVKKGHIMTFEIDGDDVDYKITGVQPDGEGVTRLLLSKD